MFNVSRMWKTLTEFAQTWRHRKSLITLWNKVNLSLLMRVAVDLYGSTTRNNSKNFCLVVIFQNLYKFSIYLLL